MIPTEVGLAEQGTQPEAQNALPKVRERIPKPPFSVPPALLAELLILYSPFLLPACAGEQAVVSSCFRREDSKGFLLS